MATAPVRPVGATLSLTALILLLGAPPLARADPESLAWVRLPAQLGLDEALRIFRQHGLDLLIAEAAVQNAAGDVQVAGAVQNPQLSGTVGHTFNYNPSNPDQCPDLKCSSLPWSLSLSDQNALGDVLSGKRGLRLEVARAALAAARMSRVDAERTIAFQIKQQYFQVALNQRLLVFAREVQRSATDTYELNKVRNRAGAIGDPDLLKTEVAKLEAEQAVDSTLQSLRQARVQLAFLLGVRGQLPAFQVQADILRSRVPAALGKPSLRALLDQALARRPDLKGARLQEQRARSSISLARRLIFPDFSVDVSYAQEGTGQSAIQPPTLTFGLGVTLPIFYQRQGELTKSRADLAQQRAQRAKTEAQVAADVESALAAFLSSKRLVDRMEGRLLQAARRSRDLAAFQYRKGAASLLEYLDAQRTFIANNVEYLQDLASYRTAVAQLEQAVGTELP